jgi:hypothetical protein
VFSGAFDLPAAEAVWNAAASLGWPWASSSGTAYAAGNTSVRYLLPEFTGGDYLLSWCALAAVNVAVALALVRYTGPDLSRPRVRKAPGPRGPLR